MTARSHGRASPDRGLAPIFIVGCGRSGTTALYEILCAHPATSWFSNYTNKFPRLPQLAALARLPARVPGTDRVRARPVEGYRLFDSCRPHDRLRPLTERDVSESERRCLRHTVTAHMKYQRAVTFTNKNTRNSRRIRYLNAIFPDARFIHVLRDPRGTVASLINVSWWNDLEIWSHDAVTPREWKRAGRDETTLAAEFWNAEVQRILQDKEHLAAARYIEIRYEELTARPEMVLRQVLDHIHLPWTPSFAASVAAYGLDDRNTKITQRLTPEQVDGIRRVTAPVAGPLGY